MLSITYISILARIGEFLLPFASAPQPHPLARPLKRRIIETEINLSTLSPSIINAAHHSTKTRATRRLPTW